MKNQYRKADIDNELSLHIGQHKEHHHAKKFLRIIAMSVVSLAVVAPNYLTPSRASDDENEFESKVRPHLMSLICQLEWHLTNEIHAPATMMKVSSHEFSSLGYTHKITRYQELIPTIYKVDVKRGMYCEKCKTDIHITDKKALIPRYYIENRGEYQNLVIEENLAAWIETCPRAKPPADLAEIMTRAEISPGTSIRMMTAIEQLWRATRPANINYRVEKVDYVRGSNPIDEHTPLCTPECDVLLLKTIIYPPIERKTTSCCCYCTIS